MAGTSDLLEAAKSAETFLNRVSGVLSPDLYEQWAELIISLRTAIANAEGRLTMPETKAKHTPGPCGNEEKEGVVHGEMQLNGLRFACEMGCTVTVYPSEFPVYAAAPDLLEAAKQAHADLIGGWKYIKEEPDLIDATIITLQAAIAKAEGL